MDEPTSSLDLDRDRAADAGHRRAQGRRRQRHLHLAPPERGRALRRSRRRAARRAHGRRARPRAELTPRRDDPADDRARPEVALHPAGGPIAGDSVLEIVDVRDRHLPGPARSACRSAAARSSVSPASSAPGAPSSPAPSSASIRCAAARSSSTANRSCIAHAARGDRARAFICPEDRKRSGLLLDVSIAENISLPDLASYARFWLVRYRARDSRTRSARSERLNIRAPDVATSVGTLSGGNQQKVVLAKWLSMRPKVMIFDEPTRGIDVGAKHEIYEMHAHASPTRASRS